VLRPDAEPPINAGETSPFIDGTHNNYKSRVSAQYSLLEKFGILVVSEATIHDRRQRGQVRSNAQGCSQFAAYHQRCTLIAQHDGPHSLAPGDDPINGLSPIAVSLNVHIPLPYMQQTFGIRAEDRIVFEHSD
jgi:hypothetical protein